MYGDGRQLLREHIKNKRASEGLEEIPEDLFAKRPKHDMSAEEKERMLERRRRNKEAAEKSRKKKKIEFEKLQIENDQLNQDKCELVAMVEKLKTDISGKLKENDILRTNYDQLRRWVGKRAGEFGLAKYIKQDVQNKGKQPEAESPTTPLLHGDPTLYMSDNSITKVDKIPASPRKTPSPPLGPSGDRYQPIEIQPVPRPQLRTPWLVDQPVSKKKQPKAPMPFTPLTAQFAESQPLVVGEGQQVVYLPKDAIIILQGENRPVVAASPDLHQVEVPTSKFAVEPLEKQNTGISKICSTKTVMDENLRSGQAAHKNPVEITMNQETNGQNTSSCMDPETATAIESLLKLGYRIEMPGPSPDRAPPTQSAPSDFDMDHSYDAPDVLSVPMNAPESPSTVTVTTTTDTETTRFSTISPLNCAAQLNMVQKLREAGYAVQTMPVGSVLRVQD